MKKEYINPIIQFKIIENDVIRTSEEEQPEETPPGTGGNGGSGSTQG